MSADFPCVSVIVPVYNNEKHIGQALESLVNQSLPSEKCEIIAIDDGSTDSSGAICDSYAKAHANVIVVHQENGGVSRARNNGLALARGKYIAFLDSDDTLEPQTLESAAHFFDQHYSETDAVVYPMALFNDTRTWPHVREEVLTKSGIYDLSKIQHAFALVTNVNVMVKNDANLPRFQENLLVHEDELFFMNILLRKLTVGFSKAGCYRYRQEGGSAIYTKMHPYYQFENNIAFWEELFNRYPNALPLYLQASYLNELNWKLKKDYVFPYHYPKEEFDIARNRISALLSRIDNDLILVAPRSDEYLVEYFLSLKKQRLSCRLSENGAALFSGNEFIFCRKHVIAEIYRTKGEKSHWHIEGVLKSFIFSFFGKPTLTATVDGSSVKINATITPSSRSRHLAHAVTNTFWNFELDLPLKEDADISLDLVLNDISIPISFVFSNRSSLNSKTGLLSCLCNKAIITAFPEHARFHIQATTTKRDQKKLLRQNNSLVLSKNKKAYLMRKLIQLPMANKRPIWLYYDRKGVRRDNAYYQFLFDFEKKDGVVRYYITDNPRDVNTTLFTKEQLRFVIPFSSNKHRYLHLKASKVIVSYIEHENWRPFFQKALDSVADLVNYDLVYLQHGILHAHMPWKYSADRLLMDKEVVSTCYEHRILRDTYGFSEKKLILSGMPRFDFIDHNAPPKKKILFAPSWRKYLVDEVPPLTFKPKTQLFEQSSFWNKIRLFFENTSLEQMLAENGYELDIKLHPIFGVYKSYFEFSNTRVNLVDDVSESEYQILITDYSSWVYDFVYLKRAIIYFFPDTEEFSAGLNGYRELDMPLEQGFGPIAKKEEELLEYLGEAIGNKGHPTSPFAYRMDRFFYHYDNKQRYRLYNALSQS